MKAVARHGFNATVDEIAEESGVSPRTIFRHYRTQAVLIAETLDDMFEAGTRPIDGLPQPEDDLDGWLDTLAFVVHTRNVDVYGEAIWALRGPTTKLPPQLAETIDERVRYRRRALEHFATVAWQAAGGAGPAPESLKSAFAVQLSPYAAEVLMIDRGLRLDEVGSVVAHVLRTLLRSAVDAHAADDAR
jgi:AcrR family transcriptional regulator